MKKAIIDNFSIRLMSDSQDHFDLALEIAFNQHGHDPPVKRDGKLYGQFASHYAILEEKVMIFFWAEESMTHFRVPEAFPNFRTPISQGMDEPGIRVMEGEVTKLPPGFDVKAAQAMAWTWLQNAAKYPESTGWSGDVEKHKGFYLFTDYWGHVADSHYGIIGVEAVWALVGK